LTASSGTTRPSASGSAAWCANSRGRWHSRATGGRNRSALSQISPASAFA
jgi:hypothetical protein